MGKDKVETKASGKGRSISFLVNGKNTKRVDYIRDRYYDQPGDKHDPEKSPKRADILKEVRKLQGREDIPYQIIFAATNNKDNKLQRPVAKPKAVKAPKKEAAAAK